MAGTSRTQLDSLGQRLKAEPISDDDLRMLDEYRHSFVDAYSNVVRRIRECLAVDPTGRPSKSTLSIVQKLRRESIRLSQIQDIAGCRIIVSDIQSQDDALDRLCNVFPNVTVHDRRDRPSHGYRAVHAVVRSQDRWIEIQLRTPLQHRWAELSEKLSDVVDATIKYGGGPGWARELLSGTADLVRRIELLHREQLDKETRRHLKDLENLLGKILDNAKSQLEQRYQQ